MNTINEQLIKKDCKTGEVHKINPITSLRAVIDTETGKTLEDILINNNHIYVPFTSNSKAITRTQIPANLRRRGLWVTYVSCQGKVTTEWYNSDAFDDVNWGRNDNWVTYINEQYIKDLVEDAIQSQFGDINEKVERNATAINEIKGVSGAASIDEYINTIADITNFFTGYTTSDTLKGIIDKLDAASKEELTNTINEINRLVTNTILTVTENLERVEEIAEGAKNAALYASDTAEAAQSKVSDLSTEVLGIESELRANIGTLTNSINTVDNKVTNLTNQVGATSGIAPLGPDGRVPSTNLPSYVDDVLEYDSIEEFPSEGEEGKIYVAKDTNLTYRWSGSQYVEISPSIGLGETAQTAYPGNKGKKNADDIAELGSTVQSQEQRLTNIEKSPFKKLTTAEINAYTPENEGELIYNTDTKQYVYWNGSSWTLVGEGEEVNPGDLIGRGQWLIAGYSNNEGIPQVGDKRYIIYPSLPNEKLDYFYERLVNASTEADIAQIILELTVDKPIWIRTFDTDFGFVHTECSIFTKNAIIGGYSRVGETFISWTVPTQAGNYTVVEKLSFEKAPSEEQNAVGRLTAECVKSINSGPIQVVSDVHSEDVIINQGDLVYDTSKGGFFYRDKFNNVKQVAEADKFNLIGFVNTEGEDFDNTPNIGASQRILFPDYDFNEDGFEVSELENIFQESSNFKVTLNNLLVGYNSFDLLWYVSPYKYISAPCTAEITYNISETSLESWPVFTWMWGSKLITSELRYVLFDEENMPSGSGNLTKGYLQLYITNVVDLVSGINVIHV